MESPDGDVMKGATPSSHEKIFVSVRVRPLNEKEISNNDVNDWDCINDHTIFYKNGNLSVPERSMYPTIYGFDRVFGNECSTRQVYEQGAKEVALSVVNGINSSIFAYGQTSSGKTYTMTGVTRYSITDIYGYINKHKEREFVLKFSAMEIYNESVRDLLSPDTTPLRLLDDPEKGTVVEKLTEETVRDRDHLIHLVSICEAQRQIGETNLNETSSRSHQILRLTIESSARGLSGKDNSSTLSASVNFVDLAGSERASQALTAGTRLKEGAHINRSLLTLGTVIRKLSQGKGGHIPYRDSKLTRILQPSLGGNARTAIICTMSPARSHVEQSRNALLFASVAKEVSTSAHVNVVMSDKTLIKNLQREVERLESEIRNPGSTSISRDYAALLKEKDHQIEKLEKEVKGLILQRDIAQAQFKEVVELLGEDGQSLIHVGSGYYPNLRIRLSPESEGTRDSPGEESRNSYEDNYSAHVTNYEEDFMHNKSTPMSLVSASNYDEDFMHKRSPLSLVSASNYSEFDYSVQEWDEMENKSRGRRTIEEYFNELRSIEMEESRKMFMEANRFSPVEEERNGFPALKVSGNDENTPENERVESLKNEKVNNDNTKSTSPQYHKKNISGSGSKSCHARLGNDKVLPEKPVALEVGVKSSQDNAVPGKNEKIKVEPIMKPILSWPMEFKRLQSEIVKLWQDCHVSLVHRTYFFLLFQGDPSDALYLEVELRKLSFLKDSFARGDKTVVRGQTLSLQSNVKALRQERRMLSSQMMKKLSEEERDMLFLKWGIGLDTKLRRQQLANRLWSNTDDMIHVNDSAYLVGKLVGFFEQGQAQKEMFSLDFSPGVTTGSYSFKRGLISLL